MSLIHRFRCVVLVPSVLVFAAGIAEAWQVGIPPQQRCSVWCGNPPVEIGHVSCPKDDFCCFSANCVTEEFAGVCCDSSNDCCTGLDENNGYAPYANCSGSGPGCGPVA